MSARQSVHCFPLMASPIELAELYRTSYQRPPGSIVMSQKWYKTTNIWPYCVQAHGAHDVLEWLQPSGR